MGVNFLSVTGRDAFPILGRLETSDCPIDAYWADDARIDETGQDLSEARQIAAVRAASGWQGLYFGGTAFKKQRPVEPARWQDAAREAVPFMDVVTTSGGRNRGRGRSAESPRLQGRHRRRAARAGLGRHAGERSKLCRRGRLPGRHRDQPAGRFLQYRSRTAGAAYADRLGDRQPWIRAPATTAGICG